MFSSVFLNKYIVFGENLLRIGIYLGDIKKPASMGGLTLELSFVDELLKRDTNHEFVFYYFGKKGIFEDKENIKFVSLNYYKKPIFSFTPFHISFAKAPFVSLNHRLKNDNINVVYFLTPYLFEHIEIPYFAVIREVAHRILPHFPEYSTNAVFEKREKKLKLFLMGASRIITCNPIVKNDIKVLYDIIDENIEVISLPYPNWVKNSNENSEILKKHNLSKNSFILYPASFWTHKNHIRLILAAQIIKERNMNLKVVFSGIDRGNKKYLLNQVQKLDLTEDVLFLDYVEQSELMALYKNAFAVVYPSLAGPDSIVALEAIYFNCPVLISNHLGYNYQLKNSALYFNPLDESDILEKLDELTNTACLDELISNGKILINENQCKYYIDKFLNLMDDFYLTRQCWSLKESYNNK